jgi:hypothetical protein
MKQSYTYYQLHNGFLLGLLFDPEDRGDGLHCVISKNIELFITTAAKT